MNTIYKFVILFLLFICENGEIFAQQKLVGHYDLWGAVNPAFNKSGDYSSISFLHRTQWEGFGPKSSILHYNHSYKNPKGILSPRAVGGMIQHNDNSLITNSLIRAFISNRITEFHKYKLNVGISLGVQINSLKIGDFGILDLADPEINSINERIDFIQQIGFSIENNSIQFGFSTELKNKFNYSNANFTANYDFPIKQSKFRLKPIFMLRFAKDFKYQIETQIQTNYANKVYFTAGYRQHFGPIFQLGMSINKKIKASYGAELPSANHSTLGSTHEIYLSYKYHTQQYKTHLIDSISKAKIDSINKQRIAILIEKEKNKQEDIDKLDIIGNKKDDKNIQSDPDPVENLPVENLPEENQNTQTQDEIITFDNIPQPKDIIDNTRVELSHVGFEINSDIIRPYAYKELEKLADYLIRDKRHNIEVQGHTDDTGTRELNIALSNRRSLAVANYLISRGVKKIRISIVGYGDTKPMVPNSNAKNRELNRRIEIIFHKRN